MENEKRDEVEFSKLMVARGWMVDPWQVKKGDEVGILIEGEPPKKGTVANITTGAAERRFSVYVQQGEDEPDRHMVFAARTDRDLIPDDSAREWSEVVGFARAAEVAGVPKAKKARKSKKEKPSLASEASARDMTPDDLVPEADEMKDAYSDGEPSFISELPPGERDPTDQGIAPIASDDGAERGQSLLVGAFGTLEDEKARVEVLREDWEAALGSLETANDELALLKEKHKPLKKLSEVARGKYKAAKRTLNKLRRQVGQ